MTNEEVSDWLYRIRSRAEVFMSEDQNAKAKEAVATAINALKHQKTGKWIPRSEDCRGYTSCFECSNCHAFTYLSYCEKSCDYECCPNCGARMEVYGDDK